ncbi:Glycosyl transferase protein, partial [Marine Group I thaumarchaeote SCGC AAA799-E16]
TKCNSLGFVDYSPPMNHEFRGDKYSLLLQKYRASIAASTMFPTIKYLEIPAAGCLTFMEITDHNYGKYLGFTNYENAIFINEKNYQKKLSDYVSDPDNSKWKDIANSGREYVMNHFTNDHAINSLIDF